MKYFIAAFFISCSVSCFAQADSATVRLVFDYMNSSGFKTDCYNFIITQKTGEAAAEMQKRKRKRKIEIEKLPRPFFLADKYCFIPFKYFLIEDSTRENAYRRYSFDTIPNKINYIATTPCESKLVALMMVLKNDAIRVDFFEEPDMFNRLIYFGVAYSFKFQLLGAGKIKINSYGEIICN